VNRIIKETLEERTDELVSKLKTNVEEMSGKKYSGPKSNHRRLQDMSPEEIDILMNQDIDSDDEEVYDEFDEGFDDPDAKEYRGGKDYNRREFKPVPQGRKFHRNLEDDSATPRKYFTNQIKNSIDDELDDLLRRLRGDDEDSHNKREDDLDPIYEGEEMCECGGMMYEGECMECGKSYMDEDIYDVDDLDKSNEFDYVQEDDLDEKLYGGQKKLDKNKNGRLDSEDFKMMRGEVDEKLHGGQKKLDKNKNGRLDSEDFKMMRKKVDEKWDTETNTPKSEKGKYKGKSLSELKSMLAKVKKSGPHKKGSAEYEKQNELEFAIRAKSNWGKVKESVTLREEELVNLIESIVKEENKLRTIGGKPKGLTKYEQVHAKDGKENNDYLKSVAKKMKDYLKDGSKGEYSESPKHFPKGNGELEKMAKKAYIPSGAVQDYVDNFTAAALENLDYDEIHPNEEWVTNNIEGSSKTGNGNWANSVETPVNKKRNKIRKDNLLAKIKRKAYNKAPQPIVKDTTGDNEGDKIMAKLESIEPKKLEQISEEFNKMKSLISYDRKTQ
jgi:hypothetical protein